MVLVTQRRPWDMSPGILHYTVPRRASGSWWNKGMDRAARRDEHARWMNREEPCLFEMVVRRTHLTRHYSPSTPHPFASSRHAFLRVPASRLLRGPLIWKSGGSPLFGRQVHIPHARNRPLAASKRAGSYSRCSIMIRAGELVCSLKQLNWRWANWGQCLRCRIHLSGSNSLRFSERYVLTWSNGEHRPSTSSQHASVCCQLEAG
jgi:hypothetical protein